MNKPKRAPQKDLLKDERTEEELGEEEIEEEGFSDPEVDNGVPADADEEEEVEDQFEGEE